MTLLTASKLKGLIDHLRSFFVILIIMKFLTIKITFNMQISQLIKSYFEY